MNRRPWLRGVPVGGVPVALGLLTVAWPLSWAPAWSFVLAGLAAAAVLGAATRRWRRGPGLAVAAAIVCCAFSSAGVAVLAAEGLFILGYLLAVDAPAGLVGPGGAGGLVGAGGAGGPGGAGRWLRRQAVLLVAGLVAAGAVLAALAVRPSASAWLALAGLAAAVAAYLVALPSRRRRGSRRGG